MRAVTKADIRAAAGGLYDESEFELWFASPQAALGGAAPAQLVDSGRGGEAMRLIAQTEPAIQTNGRMA